MTLQDSKLALGLSAAQLDLLRARLVGVQLRAGEVLFRQGDPGDALYLVMRGAISVVAGLQGKRVWLLTADDDEHATPEQNQALFDAIPSADKKHLHC